MGNNTEIEVLSATVCIEKLIEKKDHHMTEVLKDQEKLRSKSLELKAKTEKLQADMNKKRNFLNKNKIEQKLSNLEKQNEKNIHDQKVLNNELESYKKEKKRLEKLHEKQKSLLYTYSDLEKEITATNKEIEKMALREKELINESEKLRNNRTMIGRLASTFLNLEGENQKIKQNREIMLFFEDRLKQIQPQLNNVGESIVLIANLENDRQKYLNEKLSIENEFTKKNNIDEANRLLEPVFKELSEIDKKFKEIPGLENLTKESLTSKVVPPTYEMSMKAAPPAYDSIYLSQPSTSATTRQFNERKQNAKVVANKSNNRKQPSRESSPDRSVR